MPNESENVRELLETLESAQESLLAMKRRKRETTLSAEALKAAKEGLRDEMTVQSVEVEPRFSLFPVENFGLPGELAGARTLEDVRDVLGDCRRCKLWETRKNIVFGIGDPHADLMFIGEGPGADEDAKGEPFVGRAGQLLTKMIEAMGKTRRDVYIANVVKCRPPDNRFPEPDEIAACLPFLKAQIMVIRPKIICALGNAAMKSLLESKEGITKLRGRFTEYMGIAIMPTYHPSYLLRNPVAKRDVWEDLKAIMERLAWEQPKKGKA
jgi:uracil-DNA glycosylase